MEHPLTLNDSNFTEEVLKSNEPVLVDFWAPWCGPCRMIAPLIEEISSEYAGRVKVGKLNTDENQNTAAQFRIMGIPSMLIYKNGEVVDRIVGVVPKDKIVKSLEKYLTVN